MNEDRKYGESMKKILLTFFLTAMATLAVCILAAGYYVGNYMVSFGLVRGTPQDPLAPPRAYALLMPPGTWSYTPPQAVGQEWTMETDDGLLLKGTHFFPWRQNHNWVIVVHGYGCSQENAWYMAQMFLDMGFDVLTPDLRSAGKSEGKYVTLGWREAPDIAAWARLITEKDPQARIVLQGVSMGAATVMMAAADPELPSNVVAVIEDCGYTDAYALLSYQMEESFHLPSFPGMELMDWRCRKVAGFSLRQAAPIEAVRQTHIPMMFIHGTKDTLVPPEMAQQLYEACPTEKRLLLVRDAVHAASAQQDHNRYLSEVRQFLQGKVYEMKGDYS
jgi:fermentation-respiration switch protein FrsA (DUF1100 family)